MPRYGNLRLPTDVPPEKNCNWLPSPDSVDHTTAESQDAGHPDCREAGAVQPPRVRATASTPTRRPDTERMDTATDAYAG